MGMSSEELELAKGLLLEEGEEDFVEGCPGCKCAHYQRPGAPLPKEIMFILSTMMLCNTLPVQILYPYLYFMVEDFNVDKQKIGTYAGLIASSFLVGRTFTSIPWGMVGDKYGRKVVLFCGMLSLLVFNTWFGLTRSFAMAFTSRFLLGAFSGLLATLQAYAVEIVSPEQRALSLSVVGSIWGVGLVVGPALGGFLAQPAERFGLFKDTLFEQYPYFLPPLVVSIFGFIITLLLFRLPETLHNHAKVFTREDAGNGGSILRNYPFWSSNILYCVWAFQEMSYNETFSLWAVSPGGLGLSSQDVGAILAANGAVLLLFSIFIFPRLARRFSLISISRAGAVLLVPLIAAHPSLETLHGSTLYVALTILTILRVCVSNLPAAALFLLVNNSVTQAERSTANGVATCFVSLARALGPTIGGFMFSLAQSRPDAAILPRNQLLYFFINVITVVVLFGTLEPILPESTNRPK